MPTPEPAAPVACAYVLLPGGRAASADARVEVWGLTAEERLRRSLQRVGVEDVFTLGPGEQGGGDASASEAGSPGHGAPGALATLLVSDHFFDERLIDALGREGEALLLVGDDGTVLGARVSRAREREVAAYLRHSRDLAEASDAARPAAPAGAPANEVGLRSLRPGDLVPAFDPKLRKHNPPFVHPARADRVRETEQRLFDASYKGVTDLVTKWVWPRPAQEVTRWCVRAGITPNAVTAVSYLLVFAVIALFAAGHFGAGLTLGWLMTFLDTVDGKLARVTLTSTKFGHVFDHALDLVHPPFWWAAWAWGLAVAAGAVPADGLAGLGPWLAPMLVVVIGYVVGRLLEGVFLLAFDQEMFTWRPFDAAFRQVIARRNPNLLLLSAGVLIGQPGLGFLAVAAWTVGSIAIQLVRIAQACAVRLRGQPIRPWYEEDELPAAGGKG